MGPTGAAGNMRLMLCMAFSTAAAWSPSASALHGAVAGASLSRVSIAAPCVTRSTGVHMAALPALPVVAAACTLPTCVGFWKTEYGVSYAYGAATAICGALAMWTAPNPIAQAHSAAVCMYGVRLSIFLLWREIRVPQFRELREKIEARTVAAGGRLKRAPFVLSCSLLYFCMVCPTLVTARIGVEATIASVALMPLVAIAWFGLLLAAWGDFTKSHVKARDGSHVLVMTGPFRFFRHPNYTGEQILWTSNTLLAFAGAAIIGWRQVVPFLAASLIGWAGIFCILARATAALEKKQAKRFEEFQAWRRGSWGGWRLTE